MPSPGAIYDSNVKPITVIGGGLAGLTLGIALRRQQVPVTVFESGTYPRHRVCGEFINGRGNAVLERLGIRELLVQNGARCALTGRFNSEIGASPVRALPEPALCLSRYVLDALLAENFVLSGGVLRTASRAEEQAGGEGTVWASGRRRAASEDGWRWFGVKAHARNVHLEADLEMHVLAHGYVGLCRLGDGEVNVCGLFRRRASGGETSVSREDLLRGRENSQLKARLAEARFEPDSFCSVAGLSLRPRRGVQDEECCVGDALTMTPPVTGNGMSMAFESAELAAGPIAEYSQSKLSWAEARLAIARACDKTFARRLACARALQWMMFSPLLRGWLGRAALRSEWLWRVLFASTR